MNTILVNSDRKGLIDRLQFNLWDSKVNNLHFLDIGILCINEEQTITITLPGGEDLKVLDLFDRFDAVVANAIFNCSISVTINSDKMKTFSNEETKEKIVLSPIDIDKSVFGKTIRISIPRNDNHSIQKRYYRLRVLNYDFNSCLAKKELKSKLFESSFSSSSIIDFRINDIKLLRPSEASELASSEIKFGKIHFLYITDMDVDVSSAESQTRFLERTIWDNYLELKERKGEMLAYHVKSDNDVTGDCFLLKSKFFKTSSRHLLIYAVIVVGLSFLGSLLANLISCSVG